MKKILRRPWLNFLSSGWPLRKAARSDIYIERVGSNFTQATTYYQFQQLIAVRAPLATLLRFGFSRDRLVIATDEVVHGPFPAGLLGRPKARYIVQKRWNNWGRVFKPAEAERLIAEYNARIPERPAEMMAEFPRKTAPQAG